MNPQYFYFYLLNFLLCQPLLISFSDTITDKNVQTSHQFLDLAPSNSSDALLEPPLEPTSPCSPARAQATTIPYLDYSNSIHTDLLVLCALISRRAHSAHHSQSHLLYIKAKRISPNGFHCWSKIQAPSCDLQA